MVLDERSRHELYLRLEEALGADAATTLMEHLPPIGWADVAMKRDLDALEQRLDLRFDLRFDAIDQRFDAVDQRFETLGQHLDLRFGALEQRIDLRSEALEHKLMAAFRGELQTALTAQGRQLAITLAGTAGALSALAFAAARLT
jgi:hypothetical protein